MPYAEARRRACVVVRSGHDGLIAVFSDPYDTATQDLLEERVREPFTCRLAEIDDIDAYLAQQEQMLRAMDGVRLQRETTGAGSTATEDVSIEAIDQADSQVVKLVTSTLYDAIKA